MEGRAGSMPKDNLSLIRAMDSSGSPISDEQLLGSLLLQLLETPAIPRIRSSGLIYDYSTLFFTLPLDTSGGGAPLEPADLQAAAYIAPIETQSAVIPVGRMSTVDISQNNVPTPANAPAVTTPSGFFFPTWEERSHTPPPHISIRLLEPPAPYPPPISHLWARDYTLTEWFNLMAAPDLPHTTSLPDGSGGMIDVSSTLTQVIGTEYRDAISAVFYRNQRNRWLARKVINRWRQRVWHKKPQCGVDLIEMEPVRDADAIFLTDTAHRTVYKFHRRDIFNCLISNICSADEMLPNPRLPTNPWTNAPLTLAQTITVCQQLISDYARRGRCPPVLFAAFCAAGYSLPKFLSTNSAMLSQYAITAYFKDIHPHNIETVVDTILQLLTAAAVNYSPVAMRRWLRQTPVTPLHREWLALARDYTLFINLHIQARPTWYDDEFIFRDVRRLYSRTRPADPAGSRIRLTRTLGNAGATRTPPIPMAVTGHDTSLTALSLLLGGNYQPLFLPTLPSLLNYFDISGAQLD